MNYTILIHLLITFIFVLVYLDEIILYLFCHFIRFFLINLIVGILLFLNFVLLILVSDFFILFLHIFNDFPLLFYLDLLLFVLLLYFSVVDLSLFIFLFQCLIDYTMLFYPLNLSNVFIVLLTLTLLCFMLF